MKKLSNNYKLFQELQILMLISHNFYNMIGKKLIGSAFKIFLEVIKDGSHLFPMENYSQNLKLLKLVFNLFINRKCN